MKKTLLLDVKNLSIALKMDECEIELVRNINFKLNKGETLAIVGESGSGKTVTVQSIIKINDECLKVKNGEILYNNVDLLKLNEKEILKYRGKKISFIFQDPINYLNPVMKIGEQIKESILINNNINKNEAKNKVIELLNKVGIKNAKDRYNNYPSEFSGGQLQRILIAIAIASKPEILICDEPTSSLDVINQDNILNLLNDLKKELGLSIIFITHNIEIIPKIADKVIIMYAGEILEEGNISDIFNNAKHMYTKSLLKVSNMNSYNSKLYYIDGNLPNLINVPRGDPFATRNILSFKIDYEKKPPIIKISDSHYVKSWLYVDEAPDIEFLDENLIKVIPKNKYEKPYIIKKSDIL